MIILKVFIIYILIHNFFFNFSIFELEREVRNSLNNDKVVVWPQSSHKKKWSLCQWVSFLEKSLINESGFFLKHSRKK